MITNCELKIRVNRLHREICKFVLLRCQDLLRRTEQSQLSEGAFVLVIE